MGLSSIRLSWIFGLPRRVGAAHTWSLTTIGDRAVSYQPTATSLSSTSQAKSRIDTAAIAANVADVRVFVLPRTDSSMMSMSARRVSNSNNGNNLERMRAGVIERSG